jgi:hypothetical protein
MRGYRALLFGVVAGWLVCWSSLAVASPSSTDQAIAQAKALEARKRWATAREAWERVIDSYPNTAEQRFEAAAHLKVLNDLVPPNTDPRKANVWRAKAFVFRTLDFRWKPKDSQEEKHVHIETTDEEVELLKQGWQRFGELVFELSRGQLRLEQSVEVIDQPLMRLSGDDSFWLGPWDVEELVRGRYEPGTLDSVFGYVKLSDGKTQQVPAAMFGGTFGGDLGPSGAGWTGIMWYPGWMTGDGEVELHEWLHQVDWAFAARVRLPDELVPSSDEGRMEGEQGGDLDYRRKPEEKNWMSFYRHLMSEHITSRMWQEARCRPWEGVTYARDWLVLGPAKYEGELGPATGKAIWDPSRAPAEGEKVGDLAWRRWRSETDMVDLDAAFGGADYAVACAFATVRSDREREAYLWFGYDDSIVAYLNGKEVFRFVGPSGASPDQASAKVRLRRGDNTVFLKVADIAGGWGFYARLGDRTGRAVKGVEWVTGA